MIVAQASSLSLHARRVRGPRRAVVYIAAIMLGACACVGVEILAGRLFGVELEFTPPGAPHDPGSTWLTVYGFLEWLMFGSAATFLYLDSRRAREESDRLQNALLERSLASKRVVESRLRAMQARVEPRFLFGTLAQVKTLYRINLQRGERMLDALIAYLRAAIPQMRYTTSTAGREVELARAYLEIARLRFGGRLTVEIEKAEGIDDVRMPPMMLLPLIDQAFVHGFGCALRAGSTRVVCSVGEGVLRIAIMHSGGGFLQAVDAETLSAIRARLESLYGADARLELRHDDSGSIQTVMELPCERVARADAERSASALGYT